MYIRSESGTRPSCLVTGTLQSQWANSVCVKMSPVHRWTVLLLVLCALFLTLLAADSKQKPKKKKDIRDYNDADMARLLEQWEVRYSGAFLWKLLHMSAANHLSNILRSNLYWHRTYPESWHNVLIIDSLYLNNNLIAEVLETQITVGYWVQVTGNWHIPR